MLNNFKKAQQNKYAIGAFNFSTLEQLKAIIEAGKKMKSPLILATSQGESNFVGKKQAVALVKTYRQETGLPIFLHLDHGKSFAEIKEAVAAGYDSIHFDGSELDFAENIKQTKEVVSLIKEKAPQIAIEGEVGYLRGKSSPQDKVEIEEKDLTKPDEALRFIEETGVNSLAIAIGNIHGVFKSGQNPHLFLDRLEEIDNKLEHRMFLVLHGGSGTPEEDIKEAVKKGITKVNVNTELRKAYTYSIKKNLEENPSLVTPYKIMAPVVESIQKVVEEKIKLFGSDNKI